MVLGIRAYVSVHNIYATHVRFNLFISVEQYVQYTSIGPSPDIWDGLLVILQGVSSVFVIWLFYYCRTGKQTSSGRGRYSAGNILQYNIADYACIGLPAVAVG